MKAKNAVGECIKQNKEEYVVRIFSRKSAMCNFLDVN